MANVETVKNTVTPLILAAILAIGFFRCKSAVNPLQI